VVPGKTLGEVLKLLSDEEEQQLYVTVGSRHIIMEIGGYSVFSCYCCAGICVYFGFAYECPKVVSYCRSIYGRSTLLGNTCTCTIKIF